MGSRCYLVQVPGNKVIKRHIDQLIINKEVNSEQIENNELPIIAFPSELNEGTDIDGIPQGFDEVPTNNEQNERRYPERVRIPPVRYGTDE